MKRLLLATAAVGALAFPALAQQQGQQSMPSHSGQQQSSQHSGQQSSQMQIAPQDLSEEQIEQLQQALNDKGFDAGDVDGQWGPQTRAALRSFQEEQGMKGVGEQLDGQTLQALGLDASQFVSSGSGSMTTGSGGQDTGSSQGMGSQGMGSEGGMSDQPQDQPNSPKN